MSTVPLSGPKVRYFDANGDPLAGGKLFSYAAGTTTPLNTFTTFAGNIANTNPVILDANGEADVWTTPDLLYKFVLEDSAGVPQWTVDNFPSGSGAGSGSSGSSSDFANGIDPGGRLALATAAPEAPYDITGATNIFYTPMHHNKVPLYDGSAWVLHSFTELSQALSDASKSPAAAVDNIGYDMFIWLDAGTLRLSRGPAWSSATDRDVGAGTTELTLVDGRLVNRYSISNGPAAWRGLYVGSIFTNSGVSDSMAKRHVWNYFNRLKRPMRVVDPAVSWTYATDAYRQANGSTANQLDFFVGIQREPVSAEVFAACYSLVTGGVNAVLPAVGIGLDSSTASSATIYSNNGIPGASDPTGELFAVYEAYPGLGRHTLRWLERVIPGVAPPATLTFWGTNVVSPIIVQSGIWGHLYA